MAHVEITRNNITEAQFRANCRQALKNSPLSGWMDHINPELGNIDGDRQTCRMVEGFSHDEVCDQRIGQVQYYCKDQEGHGYNFIWEWTPWEDEKHGTGYFYCAEF